MPTNNRFQWIRCGRCGMAIPFNVLFVVAVCFIIPGCDGTSESFTRSAIKGTVTLDNQPLDSATIRFVPTGNTDGPKTEFSISNGEFSAGQSNGPPVGNHRVEIDLVDDQWQHDDEQAIEKLRKSPRKKISRPTLPDRYHKLSTLTATIDPSQEDSPQVLTFPLTTRP